MGLSDTACFEVLWKSLELLGFEVRVPGLGFRV